jgi:hypothetical protein
VTKAAFRREDGARKPFPRPERSEGPNSPGRPRRCALGGLAGAEAPAVLGGLAYARDLACHPCAEWVNRGCCSTRGVPETKAPPSRPLS